MAYGQGAIHFLMRCTQDQELMGRALYTVLAKANDNKLYKPRFFAAELTGD
jgi:hypothetical protein